MDTLLSLLNVKADADVVEKIREIVSRREDLHTLLEGVVNEKNPIAILTAARDLYAKLSEDGDFVALFNEEDESANTEN